MLINGRYLTRAPTGVDRFANELLGAMSLHQCADRATRRLPSIAVPVGTLSARAAREALPEPYKGMPLVEAGSRSGHAWEQFDLPRAAGDEPLLNLCNTAPLMRREQLVVIHDLGTVANAGNYSFAFRHWYRLMHREVMKRSKVVATVSRFSADELTRHYGRRPRGLEVIPEGGEHILREPADASVFERLGLEGRRYVLAVGSKSPNKNFESVVKAVESLNDPSLIVVAVGKDDAKVFSKGTTAVASRSTLKMTGYVSDAALRALYEGAACFAFPSFYEGFGLPPLEAMCCGCPVIVSDRASLPEVCGDAALYCKAEDPATLAQALRRVLDSGSLRAELQQAGRARAARFGWGLASSHFEQVLDVNFH